MKKNVLVFIAAVLVIALVAGGVVFLVRQTREDNMLIGEERAQAFALTDADLDESQVMNLKTKLVYNNREWFYKIKFETHALEYYYKLDAYSGAIIEKDIHE